MMNDGIMPKLKLKEADYTAGMCMCSVLYLHDYEASIFSPSPHFITWKRRGCHVICTNLNTFNLCHFLKT
jgi:hypothetical protein